MAVAEDWIPVRKVPEASIGVPAPSRVIKRPDATGSPVAALNDSRWSSNWRRD